MFEGLKKGLGGLLGTRKSSHDESTKSSPQVKSQGLEAQEQELAPKESGEEKQSWTDKARSYLGGKADAAKEKLHDTMGMLRKDDAWTMKMWGKVDAMLPNSIPEAMTTAARPFFRAFCVEEFSIENFEFYDAVTKNTMSKKEIYETFLMGDDSPKEINVSRKQVGDNIALAAEGRYDEMDFSPLLAQAAVNMSDTYARFVINDDVLKAMFKKVAGVKAPNKVRGGYKD